MIIYLMIMTVGLSTCTFDKFDQNESDKKIKLENEDLRDFEDLKNQLTNDLVEIRKISKELTSGDTAFLSTNSYYLYQIDRKSYEPLIKKLRDKGIFNDDINTSYEGTFIFRLKENSDNSDLPHFRYTHDLVWKANTNFKPPYSGTIEVILDSAINEDWRYIYYKVQVGH